MKFLPSLERKDAATTRATSSPYFAWGFPYYSSWSVERAVKDGYERVIWVFRAVNAIASNASRLPVELRKGTEDGPLAPPQTINRLLNRIANPFESAAIFRYRLSSQLLLSKKGVFVEIVRDRVGRPAQLTLLPPAYTYPIPDRDNFVSGYRVDIGGQTPQFVPARDANGRENVLWMRLPHPIDPYSGSTPMEAAGISIDLDYYARLYNRTFLQNDGRPGGILGVKGDMDEADADELKRRFTGGPGNAGRVSVIESEHLDWVDTAVTPRDAQYSEGRKATKEDILMAFGVPESVIGNAAGRTYDNADAERLVFWMETMLPHLDLLAGFYHYLTEGGIEDDTFVVHNTETVDVLQRARREMEKHEAAMIAAGLKAQDEARDVVGLEPYDVPASRALWLPNTLQSVAADEDDAAALAPAPPPVTQHVIMPFAKPDEAAGGDTAKPATGPAPTTDTSVDTVAASLPAPDSFKAEGDRIEAALKATMVRYFKRQEGVVLQRLRGTKALKHTRYWDPDRATGNTRHWVGEKIVDAHYLLDAKRWNAELAEDLGTVHPEALAGADGVNEATREGIQKAIGANDVVRGDLAALTARVEAVFAQAVDERAAAIAERGRRPFDSLGPMSLLSTL